MQRELWSHLRKEGRILVYLRYLLGVHRRTIAFGIVVVCTMVAVAYVQHNAINREDRAQIRSCERVQVLRDQTNGLSFIAYDAWNNAAKREKSLIEATKGAERRNHQVSYRGLRALARSMVITGPTNCSKAIGKPDKYKAPAPEFIYKNGPNVAIAHRRSMAIIEKAKKKISLYDPLPPDHGYPPDKP